MNPFAVFSTIKSTAITVVVTAVIVVVSSAVGTLWYQRNAAQADAATLAAKVASLEQDVFKEKIRSSGYKIVIETLEETYSKIEANRAIETEIDKDIADAPIEDDAAIAPVLRRTLDGVGKLLHEPKN